jgi:PAS domain-containing protein
MSEEVYGPERAQRLVALLRALAERIQELDRTGRLLDAAPELQKLFGNARSELFHYEVRSTYDTPEVAESRRIVEDAQQRLDELRFDEGDEEEPWQRDQGGEA